MKKYDIDDIVSRKVFLPEWMWQLIMKKAEHDGESVSYTLEQILKSKV